MTTKEIADEFRKILDEDFGIMSDEELKEAMKKVKIPIGVFTFKRKLQGNADTLKK